MSVTVNIDLRELQAFKAEFTKRVARSTRSLEFNTNRTAFRIARRAMELTPIADKQKIEALGISGFIQFARAKKGEFQGKALKRPKPIWHYGGRARDIWVGQYVNNHGTLPPELQSGGSTAAANEKIRALVNSRRRRRGFLKSGFAPAIVNFAKAVKDMSLGRDFSQVKLLKKENGSYKIAQPGISPYAEIIHNALFSGPQSGRPYGQLTAAVSQAIREETAEMIAYQKKQLEKDLIK